MSHLVRMLYRMLNNDWLSNIDESVKANVNLIKELIDVRNEVKWVHIFDMQNFTCIIHELCVAWCSSKPIDGFFFLFFIFLILFKK